MSRRFVVDASVTLAWCFTDEDGPYATQTLEALYEAEAIAPHIWTLEVANVLAIAERKGRIKRTVADQFVSLLAKVPISVDTSASGHIPLCTLMYAREHNLSAYDASYLELAIREGVPLATQDETLLNAMRAVGVALFQPSIAINDTSSSLIHESEVANLGSPKL